MKADLIKGVLLGIIAPIIACIFYVVFINEETLENFINNFLCLLYISNNLFPSSVTIILLLIEIYQPLLVCHY